MHNFTFYSPTLFTFGDGEEKHTGALVRRFGGSRVLLVTGGGSVRRNGAYDAVTASLEAAGIPFTELSGVQANPRSGKVYEGIDLVRRTGADFLLALGGGSVIATAPAIGFGALYKRRGLVIEPQISGGASTTIYRSGTPTLGLAVSLDAALTKALAGQDARNAHVQRLHDRLLAGLQLLAVGGSHFFRRKANAVEQAGNVQPCAAHNQRQLALCRQLGDGFPRKGGKIRHAERLFRRKEADKMVRHPLHFFRGHYGSANIQPLIDLHGFRTDDLASKAFGQGDRECGFTSCRRSANGNHAGPGGIIHGVHTVFPAPSGSASARRGGHGDKTAAHCRP